MTRYAKAIPAAPVPASVFGTALVDGQLTAVEWVGVATAAQVALGAAVTSAPQCEMPA